MNFRLDPSEESPKSKVEGEKPHISEVCITIKAKD